MRAKNDSTIVCKDPNQNTKVDEELRNIIIYLLQSFLNKQKELITTKLSLQVIETSVNWKTNMNGRKCH